MNIKRNLMMMIAEQPDVFKLLDDKDAEYPDDLLDKRIFSTIKFDSTITEAITFIGTKVECLSICKNELYKNCYFTVMVISHHEHLITKTGECRTDAIADKITELFIWNNQLGFTFKLVSNVENPLNSKFYFRRLVFETIVPNSIYNGMKIGRDFSK